MKNRLICSAITLILLFSICCTFSACKKRIGKKEETSSEITTITVDDFPEADSSAQDATSDNVTSIFDKASDFVPDSTPKSGNANTVRLLDGYKGISSSQNLMIKYNFIDSGYKTSVIGAISNSGKTYVETSVSSGLNYAILINGNSSYFLLPSKREYSVIPETSGATYKDNTKATVKFMRDMLYLNPDNMTFISSQTGTENGKRLTCETYETTYTSSDGVTTKTQNRYFFSGTTLVKITNVTANQTINIEKISTSIDSGIFNVPSGWTNIEFSDIVSHMLSAASE